MFHVVPRLKVRSGFSDRPPLCTNLWETPNDGRRRVKRTYLACIFVQRAPLRPLYGFISPPASTVHTRSTYRTGARGRAPPARTRWRGGAGASHLKLYSEVCTRLRLRVVVSVCRVSACHLDLTPVTSITPHTVLTTLWG